MKTTLAVILLVFAGSLALAQTQKKAQVGFRFLENPVSAEAIGRGGTGVVGATNSTGIFLNPALLGWSQKNIDGSLHHTEGIADIDYNALAVAVRLGDVGVIGLSALMMDYGTFHGTRRANNSEGYVETGTFSPQAYAIGLAFSQKVSDRFSYGVHIKYTAQDLGSAWVADAGTSIDDPGLVMNTRGYSQHTFAMDVGAYYDFLYNGIRFGATLKNISREIRYESGKFPLPFAVAFGAAIEPLLFLMEPSADHVFVLSFESHHPRDFGEKLKFGGDYCFLQTFNLRVGYMTNYSERGFTAGVGVHSMFEDIPLRLDYAYEPFGVFGSVHHITFGVSY